MKIGVLSQWFHPEPASPLREFCEDLLERGHTLKVLTGFPNYPSGKLYTGYRQSWRHRESHGNLDIRRVPLFPSHDSNMWRRSVNYLSFAGSSTMASAYLSDCDVVYVYASPATAGAAAMVQRMLRGLPYVLHVQDLWPESVLESDMMRGRGTRGTAEILINAGLRRLYANATHIIAIAPRMRRFIADRNVPIDKISVVLNWAETDNPPHVAVDDAFRDKLGRRDRTLAVFAGNVGAMQDVQTIVRAAVRRHETPIDVAIIGSGTEMEAVRRLVDETDADNVRVLGWVPHSEMPAIFAASDYQLVTLKNRPVFNGTIPSKLGPALAHGRPIITTVPGDVAEMCISGGFGFACPPEDVDALADVFARACAADAAQRHRMSASARTFYRERMSRRSSVAAIESILVDAARRHTSRDRRERSA